MKTKHFSTNFYWFTNVLVITFLAALLWTCTKKETTGIGEPTSLTFKSGYLDSIEVINGRLVFSSLDKFDGVIGIIGAMNDSSLRRVESLFNYTSLSASNSYVDSLLPGGDIILGTILNSAKVFQVDNLVIKLEGDSIYAVKSSDFDNDPVRCFLSNDVVRLGNGQDIWVELGLENDDCSETNRSDQYLTTPYYVLNNIRAKNNSYYNYGFELTLKYNNSWGIYHKYSVKGQFGFYFNGGFQSLNGSMYNYLPYLTPSMKLVEYYATLDPKCRSCITKQKSNEAFSYSFEETLYSSTRGLQYHKGRQQCKLTIGSSVGTTPIHTMQSWVPGSCDCPPW
jgi:hypothetical protein